MMEFKWSAEPGSRMRKSHLWLVKGGKIHLFTGDTIPSVCVVVGKDYTKNGKWSHYKYRLQLAEGVTPVDFRAGFENGTIREGLKSKLRAPTDTWAEFAAALGVSIDEGKRYLLENFPKAAEHYDAVDNELAALN